MCVKNIFILQRRFISLNHNKYLYLPSSSSVASSSSSVTVVLSSSLISSSFWRSQTSVIEVTLFDVDDYSLQGLVSFAQSLQAASSHHTHTRTYRAQKMPALRLLQAPLLAHALPYLGCTRHALGGMCVRLMTTTCTYIVLPLLSRAYTHQAHYLGRRIALTPHAKAYDAQPSMDNISTLLAV